ncbi:hypothetical protein [Streptomyces griseoluteus]|uniref:hypothetical protein n=1 Tax=Streptomyces griseoluteus TaxID=29306 RepID=UPI0036FDD556
MTSAPRRFPPYPIRGGRVRHKNKNRAPQFAEIEVDLEPAEAGFAFEVARDLTVDHEPADALPRFFAAAALGIEEQPRLPEHGVVIAARVVLRRAGVDTFGSHERAFRIAGHLAARQALARTEGAADG